MEISKKWKIWKKNENSKITENNEKKWKIRKKIKFPKNKNLKKKFEK